MKSKPFTARQGDVLIERIADSTKKNKPEGRIILAFGETTGHVHEILDRESVTHWHPEGAGDSALAAPMILALGRPAELRHQEHDTITLPAGTFRVTRQREYSPAAIRNVAD